eukprot:1544299-Amphidinium_carterae.2
MRTSRDRSSLVHPHSSIEQLTVASIRAQTTETREVKSTTSRRALISLGPNSALLLFRSRPGAGNVQWSCVFGGPQ